MAAMLTRASTQAAAPGAPCLHNTNTTSRRCGPTATDPTVRALPSPSDPPPDQVVVKVPPRRQALQDHLDVLPHLVGRLQPKQVEVAQQVVAGAQELQVELGQRQWGLARVVGCRGGDEMMRQQTRGGDYGLAARHQVLAEPHWVKDASHATQLCKLTAAAGQARRSLHQTLHAVLLVACVLPLKTDDATPRHAHLWGSAWCPTAGPQWGTAASR